MNIRKAKRGDEGFLIEMVKELARYENEPEAVENTAEKLAKDLFDDEMCEAVLLEKDGNPIGFAIYYTSYSTWKGPCLYLEDLYVKPDHRRMNAGGMLFDYLVNLAKERGFARMDWQVLDWNESAINFYKKKGARIDTDWCNGRMIFSGD